MNANFELPASPSTPAQSTIVVAVRQGRRDWFRILRDLMAAKVSMTAVAKKCNRDVCTVKKWGDGGEPKESDARIVLALYAKYCPAKYRAHQRDFAIVCPDDTQPNPLSLDMNNEALDQASLAPVLSQVAEQGSAPPLGCQ